MPVDDGLGPGGERALADTYDGDQEPSFLPPFANAENKALDAHIRALEKQLEALDLELEENAGRVGVMDEHLKNVQQEITYTESRVEAERREMDTEQHLSIMAGKETARIQSDLARLQREKAELADRITGLQASVFKGSEKLDQFKLLMNWNQEELDQWAVAQKQKEEDNAALEKYTRQDQGKLKELGLAVEKLTGEVAAAKDALEGEITDTQAAQIQLERAAQDFRQLHAERQDLLRQWDEAREAMKHRDEAIQVMAAAYAERKVALRQRKAELDAQARFLAGEEANTKELEAQMVLYERETARARELQASEAAKLEDLASQVELLQATLGKASSDLAGAGSANAGAWEELEKRRKRLEAVSKRHAALKAQLEGEFGQLDSLESKVGELEALRKREEAGLKALQKQHEALRKEAARAGQRLHALRQREKELISEIAGSQGQSKNLSARLKALDEQLLRQGELMYAVDFGLQELEHRIARAGGHRSEDESRALNARIAQLAQQLEGVNAEHAMLLGQVKQAELDLGEAKRTHAALGSEKARLDGKIEGLQLETDSAARALKAAVGEREKQLVDHDVLKLQVRRLRDVLSMHADQVYSLESRKAQLKLSLDERRHEIELHRDGLRAELKLVREDIHRLTLELRDRQARVAVLATKFDALAARGRAADADGGEPKSQAYYIIKAAQEREELQVLGDGLDAKITQADAEVAALTNTLAQMQATNVAFSSSLRPGDTKEAREQQRALREQLDAAYDRLKGLRAQEAAALAELQVAQDAASSSDAELAGLQAALDELSRKKADAEQQLEQQREKEARARRAMQQAQKLLATQASLQRSPQPQQGGEADAAGAAKAREAAAAAGPGSSGTAVADMQADVQLAELRGVTRAMLQELRSLAQQHPDAGISQALEAAGLRLPSSSVAGSRASSVAGSVRSASRAGSIRSQASEAAGSAKQPSRPGLAGSSRIPAVQNMSLG